MKWYFPSLEFTMEEQFQEDWDTECDICLDRSDFFVLKHCVCSTMVCMECYYAIQATKGTNSCPGCRDVPPPVEKLSEAQIVVARWNWIRAFDEQVVKGVLTGSRVDDRRAVQEMLNTGPFTWNRGAGICLDREAARVFVESNACHKQHFGQSKTRSVTRARVIQTTTRQQLRQCHQLTFRDSEVNIRHKHSTT